MAPTPACLVSLVAPALSGQPSPHPFALLPQACDNQDFSVWLDIDGGRAGSPLPQLLLSSSHLVDTPPCWLPPRSSSHGHLSLPASHLTPYLLNHCRVCTVPPGQISAQIPPTRLCGSLSSEYGPTPPPSVLLGPLGTCADSSPSLSHLRDISPPSTASTSPQHLAGPLGDLC
jgi:hypothetical protein